MTVLALVSDLFFGSKVAATARAHGIDYRGARSREAMRNPELTPSLVIVDLEAELPDGDAADTVSDALRREPRPFVVAFAGHLLADRLEAARAAGADLVLTKGGFTGRLEAMMAAAASGRLPVEP
jgi:DNA-binding NarL/FixJ family response regulator